MPVIQNQHLVQADTTSISLDDFDGRSGDQWVIWAIVPNSEQQWSVSVAGGPLAPTSTMVSGPGYMAALYVYDQDDPTVRGPVILDGVSNSETLGLDVSILRL